MEIERLLPMKHRRWIGLSLLGGFTALPGCIHVSSDPIEVKPIHIVADINLKIDRELDEFFAFQDKYHAPSSAPASQPAATTAAQGE